MNQASTSFEAQNAPTSSTAASIASPTPMAPGTPYRSMSVGSSSHQFVTNPPFRPDGPPPQMSDSISTTLADGSSSVRRSAVQRPV